MEATTIHFIHDAAWVVLIFTLGMLAGYLLKVVMVNLDICLPRYFDSLWEKYSSFEVDDWSQFEDDFYWECVFRLGLMHG